VTAGRINAANRFVYAVAGDSGGTTTTTLDSVEFAQVDIFGRLGPWSVQRYRLNTPRTRLGLVRQGGCFYAIGGSSTIAISTPLGSVERACILTFADAPVINDPSVMRVRTGGLGMGAWLYRVAALKDATDPENPNGESLPSDEVVATLVSNSNVNAELDGGAPCTRLPGVSHADGQRRVRGRSASRRQPHVDELHRMTAA
jgi:hypothetical protein